MSNIEDAIITKALELTCAEDLKARYTPKRYAERFHHHMTELKVPGWQPEDEREQMAKALHASSWPDLDWDETLEAFRVSYRRAIDDGWRKITLEMVAAYRDVRNVYLHEVCALDPLFKGFES